jgi:hypothetical protein
MYNQPLQGLLRTLLYLEEHPGKQTPSCHSVKRSARVDVLAQQPWIITPPNSEKPNNQPSPPRTCLRLKRVPSTAKAMPPPLYGSKLIEAIASAPDSTIRSILRALCADGETKQRIGELMAKLLPDPQASDGNASANNNSNKRKPGGKMEICARCDQPFGEEDNEGETCLYHPGE